MNTISSILQRKRTNSTCALIPFITAGYPNINMTIDLLYALNDEGADAIELGIPYSDALADGPLIQRASKVALDSGIYIDQILDMLYKVNNKLKTPIIIFTYYNPILARGVNKFVQEMGEVGVTGLIVPDLPIEETDYLIYLCSMYDIELILFIAPTSSSSRISSILTKAPGCIYLLSSTGVTGIREKINNQIIGLSNHIYSKTNKFIMLGFGISNIEQVSEVSDWNIDAIVIGSAFTRIISKYNFSNFNINQVDNNIIEELRLFCRNIKSSISSEKVSG
uniref:Tryptophan synthase alpha chain n=1 Tax=Dasyclonium flaccidum TaxID=2007274 RepID=A0A1Z1MLE5_9FLOR|nr:Tryptophan synthase alpha subunit [Dasyclonium flaccidum]ARW66571.1 Tryptophan synthase alpha subunit [Dasyclonium flaccidum]